MSLPDKPPIAPPFANLNGDPQQDYFSDGITEDVTTELSRVSDLLVIGRNFAFQYKGKAVDLRQLGRALGARYLLEGSVRRSGEVTARPIDAATGPSLGRAVRPRTTRRFRGPRRGRARLSRASRRM